MITDDGIRNDFAWTIRNIIFSREALSISWTSKIDFRDKATDDDDYSWRHAFALNNVELKSRTIRIAASEQLLEGPQDSIFYPGNLTRRDVDPSRPSAPTKKTTKIRSAKTIAPFIFI